MDPVFKWVEKNIGSTFSPPREKKFGTGTRDFQIMGIDYEKVSIKFARARKNEL